MRLGRSKPTQATKSRGAREAHPCFLGGCFVIDFAIRNLSFAMQGFRLCGGDQRAFRSPFGNLRSAHPCYLTFIAALRNGKCSKYKGTLTKSSFDKAQEAWECAAKGSRGRPQSPLVASADAKSCINTRTCYASALNSIAKKGQGRNSLAGCRGSAPAGVKGQRPLGLPHSSSPFSIAVIMSMRR